MEQVRLEGKGGVVQIYDLPLSDQIADLVASGELEEIAAAPVAKKKPPAKKAPAKRKPPAKKG